MSKYNLGYLIKNNEYESTQHLLDIPEGPHILDLRQLI